MKLILTRDESAEVNKSLPEGIEIAYSDGDRWIIDTSSDFLDYDVETILKEVGIDMSSLPTVPRYRIWDFVPDEKDYEALPSSVNFGTGLTSKAHKVDRIVDGELVERIHYASASIVDDRVLYTDPIVRETWTYSRDKETGLADYRVQTIYWYLIDGTLDRENFKTFSKFYATASDKRGEILKKRSNIINSLLDIILTAMIVSGMTRTEAILMGQEFFKQIVSEQSMYLDGNPDPLIKAISASTERILDVKVGDSTCRELILASL